MLRCSVTPILLEKAHSENPKTCFILEEFLSLLALRQVVNRGSSLKLKVGEKKTKWGREGQRKERGEREEKSATNGFQLPSNIMSIFFFKLRLCNANDIMPITLSDFTKSCRKIWTGTPHVKNGWTQRRGSAPLFIFLLNAEGVRAVRTSPGPCPPEAGVSRCTSTQIQAPSPGPVNSSQFNQLLPRRTPMPTQVWQPL